MCISIEISPHCWKNIFEMDSGIMLEVPMILYKAEYIFRVIVSSKNLALYCCDRGSGYGGGCVISRATYHADNVTKTYHCYNFRQTAYAPVIINAVCHDCPKSLPDR